MLNLIEMSFKVYINEGEWNQICAWVLKHKDIETGGDLFGLWLDEQTAVVQFVIGPGKECSRTTISFFQDVDYLHEAGTYLTKHHGLCNVGQWHSHHKINLFKPSVGDKNTVWSNMPNLGLDRYIVFIANITDKVTINCFLFQIKKGQELPVKHGEFKFLDGNSPLRLNEKVLQNVHNGAESFNEITRFEKEMKYIRNKDAIENLHISNENENETSNYTGNRVQHVTSVSVEREKIKNRYTQERTTGITKELDKDKSKQKLSVSVFHTPAADRASPRQLGCAGYGSHDTKQRINTIASSGSTIQVNQRDPQQNTQNNRSRGTEQSTSAVRGGSTLSNTPSHSSWQPQDNRTTIPTTSGRGGTNENFQTLKDTQKQQEHQWPTPKTNKQASENSNFPTASQGMQKQWKHNEGIPTTSDPGATYYNSPRAPEDRKGQREHKGTTPGTTAQGPENCTQQLQSPSVKYKGTGSQAVNVIVNQPEGFGGLRRSSLKRKSGNYDNVKCDIELPQRKSSKPNPGCSPPSKDNLEKIHERPITPSGTIQPTKGHDKIKQKEDNYAIERTGNSCTCLFNVMCCKMSKLTINEPEVEEIRENKVEDKYGTKVSYV